MESVSQSHEDSTDRLSGVRLDPSAAARAEEVRLPGGSERAVRVVARSVVVAATLEDKTSPAGRGLEVWCARLGAGRHGTDFSLCFPPPRRRQGGRARAHVS